MTTELYSRISHIKQYINQLHQHLSVNDHINATNIINKFKKATMKSDPHLHANQFLLDCLKTKNEKLLIELQNLIQQKKSMQAKISQKKTYQKEMKSINASIFISRLTVSLNEVKKVQYDDVNIKCNYKVMEITSLVGNKYQNYALNVQSISNIDTKTTYCHLLYQDTIKLNILVKFFNQKDMNRWVSCLKFGIMIQNSRKKEKLFFVKKEEPQSAAQSLIQNNPPPLSTLNAQAPQQLMALSPSQLLLNFKHQASPSESVSIIEQKRQKSMMDKMQKNTQRSLLTYLNNDKDKNERYSQIPKKQNRDNQSVRDESFANYKEPHQQKTNKVNNYMPKYQKNRPPRLRGLSQNIDTFQMEMLKPSKKVDASRKNSYDFQLKPHINKIHEQMLAKMKQNQDDQSKSTITKYRYGSMNGMEQSKNSSGLSRNTPVQKVESSQHQNQQPSPRQKSQREKTLEQKRRQLISRSPYSQKLQVPAFALQSNKISWNIQQIQDQNRSRTSRGSISRMSRRDTVISNQIRYSSNESDSKNKQQDRSQHITEKSQEDSPIFNRNKHGVAQLPSKVSYSNGFAFNIIPVQKQGSNHVEKGSQIQIQKQKSDYSKEESYSSESESHVHSDPDTHQNHTETEDNAARAEQLKKPLTLTKCAEKGFWSHQKILYLSQNQSELCMRDIGDKKIKKIKLSAISSVDYGKFDQGIIRHISKIQNNKCLIIRAQVQDKKLKNFQFYGTDAQTLQRFSLNLKLFLEYNQGK